MFGGDEAEGVGLAELEKSHNVWMIERRSRKCLLLKSRQAVAVVR